MPETANPSHVDGYLTITQAAPRPAVHRLTISRFIQQRELVTYRARRNRRVRLPDFTGIEAIEQVTRERSR